METNNNTSSRYMRNVVSFQKDENGKFIHWDTVFKYLPTKYHDERCYFIKKNVSKKEQVVYNVIQQLFEGSKDVHIPKMYYYDRDNEIAVFQRIPVLNIADEYGENEEDVPKHIMNKIAITLHALYNSFIDYPDITGYNFMYEPKKDRIWIVDFEHATILKPREHHSEIMNDWVNHNIHKWNTYDEVVDE
jgi:hypothetical protein